MSNQVVERVRNEAAIREKPPATTAAGFYRRPDSILQRCIHTSWVTVCTSRVIVLD
ncbi:MAG: hypothetical protein HOG96_10335 [Porticoccaceae bacterium]|nr:hypothetical protein [Porticoccaceae bacterium]